MTRTLALATIIAALLLSHTSDAKKEAAPDLQFAAISAACQKAPAPHSFQHKNWMYFVYSGSCWQALQAAEQSWAPLKQNNCHVEQEEDEDGRRAVLICSAKSEKGIVSQYFGPPWQVSPQVPQVLQDKFWAETYLPARSYRDRLRDNCQLAEVSGAYFFGPQDPRLLFIFRDREKSQCYQTIHGLFLNNWAALSKYHCNLTIVLKKNGFPNDEWHLNCASPLAQVDNMAEQIWGAQEVAQLLARQQQAAPECRPEKK